MNMAMKNPTMTSSLYDKEHIDLTIQPTGTPIFNETDRLMLVEAHEMAAYSYEMVNTILEFKS